MFDDVEHYLGIAVAPLRKARTAETNEQCELRSNLGKKKPTEKVRSFGVSRPSGCLFSFFLSACSSATPACGPYQTVWRRSTNVNEFGMALFVPKPEPSSAHGGSGRYLLKVGIDPPTPERFPHSSWTAPRTRVPMVPAAL